jgi:hypothetical protein
MMRLLTRGIGLVAALLLLTLVRVDAAQNLLRNSAFGAGDMNGWMFGGGQSAYGVKAPLSFTNIAGEMVWRCEYNATNENVNILQSEFVQLKPSTTYNLSVEVRGETHGGTADDRFEYYVENANADTTKGGEAPGTYSIASVIFTTSWVRYNKNFTTPAGAASNMWYSVILKHKEQTIAGGGQVGKFAQFRRVQLTEGSGVQTYAPMAEMEIGANCVTSKPGHVFYTSDLQVDLHFTGYNAAATIQERTLTLKVYDIWNNLVLEGSMPWTLAAGERQTNGTSLHDLPMGHFRCAYWIAGYPGKAAEVQFSVVLPPATLSHRTNGFFGLHLLYEPWFLASAQRLGVHWTRDFSVEKNGYWPYRELSAGVYNMDTNRLARPLSYDIEVLLNLPWGTMKVDQPSALGGQYPEAPSWVTNASSGSWPTTNNYYSFAAAMAARAKVAGVKYFEIGNEAVKTNIGAYDYALKWTRLGLLSEIPDAKIAGFADYEAEMNRALLEREGTNDINFWATHVYSYSPDQTDAIWDKQDTNNTWRFGQWMTEGGLRTDSPSRANAWNFHFPSGMQSSEWPDNQGYMRESRYRLAQMSHMMMYVLRGKFSKWFYYDARTAAGGDRNITFSVFDTDMTVRPMGVLLAQTAHKIEGAELRGRIALHPKVNAFWFDKAGVASAFLWATNNDNVPTVLGGEGSGASVGVTPVLLTSSLDGTAFNVQDIWGNFMAYGSGVTLGLDPVWVQATNGTGTNALIASLAVSTVASDLTAPKLQITHWPLTNTTTRQVFIWNAQDDTVLDVRYNGTNQVPPGVNAGAIRYRTKLEPAEADYTAWTNAPWRLIESLSWDTNSIFHVQAIDAAGNFSTRTVDMVGAGGGGSSGGSTGGGTTGGASPGDGGGGVDGRARLRGLTNLRVEP